MSTTPILDDDALRRLGDQLGDPGILCRFLRRYLSLLEGRLDRVERARSGGDPEEWQDAVLSLRSSSAMAGARALAEEAGELARSASPRPEHLERLCPLAVETDRQLRRHLQGRCPAAPAG
jgi:HPt (histidine-containing phosphotransfer) domain-containing protein